MIPLSCAAASPWAICVPYSTARRSGRVPPVSSCRREWPSRHSETRNGAPSYWPISWTERMLGWSRVAMARASASNRRNRSESLANPSGRTLMATSRPSLVSRARYTSPMPPAPSGARISYGPSLVPAVSAIGSHHYSPTNGPCSRSDNSGWIVGQPEACAEQRVVQEG
jgi:hypothetical protein